MDAAHRFNASHLQRLKDRRGELTLAVSRLCQLASRLADVQRAYHAAEPELQSLRMELAAHREHVRYLMKTYSAVAIESVFAEKALLMQQQDEMSALEELM